MIRDNMIALDDLELFRKKLGVETTLIALTENIINGL